MVTIATGPESPTNPETDKPNTLRQYTAMMPADELAALDAAASAEHISRSYAIREGAKLWLKAKGRK